MAIVPIRNLGGGGGATSKFYIVKKGVSNFLIKNYATYGCTLRSSATDGICRISANSVGQTCYTKFDLTIDTSTFSQLHFVAKGKNASSGGRISCQATENSNISTWTNEIRLTEDFAEYSLPISKNILCYTGNPDIEIKDMWLT